MAEEKPATASEVSKIVENALEKFSVVIDKIFRRERKHNDERFDKIEKQAATLEVENRFNWERQEEFNQRIEKKVDMLDQSVQALDKRVQYPADAPVRLEQAETDIYNLKGRVAKVEEKVK